MRWIKCHSEIIRIHGELAWWFRHMDNGGYQICPTLVLRCVTTVRGWPCHLSLSAHLLEFHFAFSRIYRYGMTATMPSRSFPDSWESEHNKECQPFLSIWTWALFLHQLLVMAAVCVLHHLWSRFTVTVWRGFISHTAKFEMQISCAWSK